MSNDIVARLRQSHRGECECFGCEAADEIERLRAERDRLRHERDEARTMHMMLLADLGPDGLERYKNLMRNRYRPDLSLVSISWSVLERQI